MTKIETSYKFKNKRGRMIYFAPGVAKEALSSINNWLVRAFIFYFIQQQFIGISTAKISIKNSEMNYVIERSSWKKMQLLEKYQELRCIIHSNVTMVAL